MGKTVLPFPPVNFIFIPWDFVLVLVFLGFHHSLARHRPNQAAPEQSRR